MRSSPEPGEEEVPEEARGRRHKLDHEERDHGVECGLEGDVGQLHQGLQGGGEAGG